MSKATHKQATHVPTTLNQIGLNRDEMEILHNSYLAFLVKAIKKGVIPSFEQFRELVGLGSLNSNELKITLEPNLSLQQMIDVCGCDFNNPDITEENFTLCGDYGINYATRLFHFNRFISINESEKLIRMAGWNPGNIESLLTRGAIRKKEQMKFPIVASGSAASLDDFVHVAFLDRNGTKRGLYLGWRGCGWDKNCRFLAVRN